MKQLVCGACVLSAMLCAWVPAGHAGISLKFQRTEEIDIVDMYIKSFHKYFWCSSGIIYWYADNIVKAVDEIKNPELKKALKDVRLMTIFHKQAHQAKQYQEAQDWAKEMVSEFNRIGASVRTSVRTVR